MLIHRSQPPVLRLFALSFLACLMLVAFTGSAGPARAQAPLPAASTPSASGTVLVMRIYYTSNIQYADLATEFGLEQSYSPGGYLSLWADVDTFNSLVARGLHVEVDAATTKEARENPPVFGHNADSFYNGYYTIEEMQTLLDQKVAQYPTLAEKVDIGDSWCKVHPGSCTQPDNYNGYDLYAMRITNHNIAGTKPVFWFNAGLHSREIVPPELAINYINWLLDGYATNADARWLVDWNEIWIVPMSNPDGHHIVENGISQPRTQRKNADNANGSCQFAGSSNQFGTDLNRNFAFKWGCCNGSSTQPCNLTYRGPSPASEPETQFITAKRNQLIPDQRGPGDNDPAPITTTGAFLDMHSNAALTLYPWGQTTAHAPNNDDLRNMAKHMAATSVGGNGYHMEQSVGLYPTDGAIDDAEYGDLGAPGFTIELVSGGSFAPPYSAVAIDWNANRGPLIYLSKIARQPYLMTRGPDTNSVTSTPMTVTQGTPAALTGSINYNWSSNDPPEVNTYLQNVAAAEYYIDTPPWAGGTGIPMQAVDGNFNSATEAVQATVNTSGLTPGRHLLMVRGRGVNSYEGFQSWGAISAAFLDVLPGGGGTSTPIPTSTRTPTLIPSQTPTSTRTPTSTPSRTSTPSATSTPLGANTFCNTNQITWPDWGTATPYPGTINVQGLTGTITGVSVKLNTVRTDWTGDLDILLVGPQGQSVVLLSDAGDGCSSNDVDIQFVDGAPAFPQFGCPPAGPRIVSPSNYEDNNWADSWPSPAPPAPWGSALSTFNGSNPNGTWSLYVVDDYPGFTGYIEDGWCLTINTTTGTPITPPPTNTPTVIPTLCPTQDYTTGTNTDPIVPGTTFVPGSNCDDCSVNIPLPFSYRLYDQYYSSVRVFANGMATFVGTSGGAISTCMPVPSSTYTIFLNGNDLLLTTAGDGVYTSTTGTAPFRTFNMEWRGCYYNGGVCGARVNFELSLNEGLRRFELRYGSGAQNVALAGVQKDGSHYTQYVCGGSINNSVYFILGGCSTPTPGTPVATPTRTNTPLPTQTTGGSTATPIPTNTRTGTPTFTPTPGHPSSTPGTPTSTSTVPLATPTTCHCSPVLITGTSACAANDVYTYSFGVSNQCGRAISGPVSAAFQVADSASGPWTTLETTTPQPATVCGGCIMNFTGAFTETAIPAQYTHFRVEFTITWFDCVGNLSAFGDSDPNPLCRTANPSPTPIASGTAVPTPPPTATATPTTCVLAFTDVDTNTTFYANIRCLACLGIINGYTSPADCPSGAPCFKPGNNVTRGQIAKIVSNAAGFTDTISEQKFEDILPGSTFFDFVQRLAAHNVMSGYPCGGPGEPCGSGSLPYFRPNDTATRGQLAKIVSNSALYLDPVTGQTFEDVEPGDTFYVFIERLASRGVMSGYPCGGQGEPCGTPALPYFRPGSSVTRGQTSKIVANTFFPHCNPVRR